MTILSRRETFDPKPRNRNYEHTHQRLIEKATELIGRSGANGVSMTALARAMWINRSTLYYHFESREALMLAADKWSADKLAKEVDAEMLGRSDHDHTSGSVTRHPELARLWIEDCIATGDIREIYPQWDNLVAHVARAFAETAPDEICDAEVYCALMVTSAFIAPHVFKNSICPDESLEAIVERFGKEHMRTARRGGVLTTQIGTA